MASEWIRVAAENQLREIIADCARVGLSVRVTVGGCPSIRPDQVHVLPSEGAPTAAREEERAPARPFAAQPAGGAPEAKRDGRKRYEFPADATEREKMAYYAHRSAARNAGREPLTFEAWRPTYAPRKKD